MSVPENLLYAAGIVGLSLVIALVNKQMYVYDKDISHSPALSAQVQNLVRESARWHTTAQQDTNPALAVVHSTYAVAYANAARAMVDDNEIMKTSGVYMPELQMKLTGTQQAALQQLSKLCPSTNTHDSDGYSLYTGYVA